MRSLLLLLPCLFAPAGQPDSSTPEPVQEGCRRCNHRGVLACPNHDEEILAAEERVLFCSVAGRCEKCKGALVVDCPKCDGGPGSASVEARQAAVAKWLGESAIEAHFEREVPRCETRRFDIVFDAKGKFAMGRKKIDAHTLMHLVADDVEYVAKALDEHLEIKDEDLYCKMRMWMWGASKDHVSAVQKFMRVSARGDFKILGKDPVFSVWQEGGLFDTSEGIRSLFTHNSAHMIVSNLDRERDIGVTGGGWFDAGLAHWYEYERFGQSVNYCIEEATAGSNFANGVWKAAMKKLVRAKKPLFIPLLDSSTTSMTVEEQAICWSFYDWLVANHREQLRPIVRRLKKPEDPRKIMKELLGITVLEAEDQWRAWVTETYPSREKKRR